MNTGNVDSDTAFRKGAASDQDESLNAGGASTNPDTRTYTEQAKDALSSGKNAIAETMGGKTNASTSSTTTGGGGGSFVQDLKDKMTGGQIGGNQLFDKADGSRREGQAASGFLDKYVDETAPVENTA